MNKQKEMVFLQIVDEDRLMLLSFFLRIGHWKHLFEETKCKWIIAKTLNSWIEENEDRKFELAGYLITGTKLALVLKIRKKELSSVLHRFFQLLNKQISESLDSKEEEVSDSLNEETDSGPSVQFHNLFKTKAQMSPFLVKLITGREIKLPYYDFRLAKLEERVRNYNFCSAIDYSGAIGPVKTKLIDKEELDRLERIGDH